MQNQYISKKFCKEILKKFIKIDTCQPKGNESKMVQGILELFPKDISHSIINHEEGRQTLIIKLKGEKTEEGMAIIGHLDTVACGEEKKWKYPPLDAVEDGDYIYGRGAVDMKGGVVAMIATALTLLTKGIRLKNDIYFCFTADEEKGGMGAVSLSQLDYINRVREFFIAEPTNENLGLCEKGALWIKVKTTGIQAHGSRPEVGVNAIEKSLELFNEFKGYIDTTYEDKYLGHATCSITKINGGTMTNVIPGYADMEIDIRTITGIDHSFLINKLREIAEKKEEQGLKYHIEIMNNRPAVGVEENSEIVKKAIKTMEALNIPKIKKGIYYYTDASQIIPVNNKPFLIIGPGDDLLAHQTDERIDINSVLRMAEFYTAYIENNYI